MAIYFPEGDAYEDDLDLTLKQPMGSSLQQGMNAEANKKAEYERQFQQMKQQNNYRAPVEDVILPNPGSMDEFSSSGRVSVRPFNETKEAPLSAEEETFLDAEASGVGDFQQNFPPASKGNPGRGFVDKLLGLTGERYQTWPEKLARSLISAAALPGDVLSGAADNDPRSFNRAIDLAGLAVLGPAPIAKKVADGTLGSFVGVGSKRTGWDETLLQRAVRMEKAGHDADSIYRDSGWFRGLEGDWRREISDHEAKWRVPIRRSQDYSRTPSDAPSGWTHVEGEVRHRLDVLDNMQYRLETLFDHPELYKAYPELRDLPVTFKNIGDNYGAFYQPGPRGGEIVMSSSIKEPELARGILLHEIQHYIQHKEGFISGTNPEHAFYAVGKGLADRIRARRDELKAELGREPARRDFNNDPAIMEMGKLWMEMNQNRDKFADYLYRRMPGEIEARYTQMRRNWDDIDRLQETMPDYQKRVIETVGEVPPLGPAATNTIASTSRRGSASALSPKEKK